MSQGQQLGVQIRRDLARAEVYERLDWLGRIVWTLNHPDDEFGHYFHRIDRIARRYGHHFYGLTRKRLSTQDVLWSELKRLKKIGGTRREQSKQAGVRVREGSTRLLQPT
jgi:hypothetical protein